MRHDYSILILFKEAQKLFSLRQLMHGDLRHWIHLLEPKVSWGAVPAVGADNAAVRQRSMDLENLVPITKIGSSKW